MSILKPKENVAMITTNRAQIISRLGEILDRVTLGRIKPVQIRERSRVFDDLGMSSLELLELRFDIESTWNMTLEDQDLPQMQVVRDVIDLIMDRTAERCVA
jgi:acyl carrier protein